MFIKVVNDRFYYQQIIKIGEISSSLCQVKMVERSKRQKKKIQVQAKKKMKRVSEFLIPPPHLL